MKRLTLCAGFASLAIAALPLFAGKRVQMESTDLTSKAAEQQEMLLDATRFRINTGNSSVIFLTDGGRSRMLMLDKGRNEYTEVDQQTMDQMGQAMQGISAQMEAAMKDMSPEQRAQVQQMMEQMMKGKMPPQAAAAAPAASTSYAAKGRATVAGIACTNYEGTRAGQKVAEVCAAQPADLKLSGADFEVFRKMQEFSAGLVRSLQNSPLGSMMNVNLGEPGVEGFPVQRTTFQNGQATRQEVLKSVADASLTDTDFSVGNARKMELPDVSGLGVGQGKGKGKGKGK